MRPGHIAVAYQLTDVQKDWGGFGVRDIHMTTLCSIDHVLDHVLDHLDLSAAHPQSLPQVVPGSHKCNLPLPAELRETSLRSIQAPLVCPAAPKGSMLIFFESALHASLPWFGPTGTERRSLLFRIAPSYSSHRSGRGTHWGGTWTYEAVQPGWVEEELTAEQQETVSAARGSLASTFPAVREGYYISGGALHKADPADRDRRADTHLDYIGGRHGYRPRG